MRLRLAAVAVWVVTLPIYAGIAFGMILGGKRDRKLGSPADWEE